MGLFKSDGSAALPVPASTLSSVSSAPSPDLKRCHFLLSMGAGGVSAAAVAVAAIPGSAAAIEATTAANIDESGYRETEHVRDYYRTARL